MVWPPHEKVGVIGVLSGPDIMGIVAAGGPFVFALLVLDPVTSLYMFPLWTLPVLAWTLGRWHGVRVRTRVGALLRWWFRRRRSWSAPLRGKQGSPQCLRQVRLVRVNGDATGVVGVSVVKKQSYTVVMAVDSDSVALLSPGERSAMFDKWGDFLSGLCVERDTLGPERVSWTDVHRAADPAALVAYHREHGRAGPATAEFVRHIASFGSVSSEHRVLVSVTITRATSWRLAKHDFRGRNAGEAMAEAAVRVGEGVADTMRSLGFRVGALLSPAEMGRMIVECGDPFAQRPEGLTVLERFGVPERTGPDQLTVERHAVAIDGAYHRSFMIQAPKTRVDTGWMWRPLSVEGPKMLTVVYEAIPPSTADARRDALTTRAKSNIVAEAVSTGRVRTVEQKKAESLSAAERAVANGHGELDGYMLVVISARTIVDLDRRCQLLRNALRQEGRATLRELTAVHDAGWVAALPIGFPVAPAKE